MYKGDMALDHLANSSYMYWGVINGSGSRNNSLEW
jgi:hypothetical protein